MTGFGTLVKKETREQIRTFRLAGATLLLVLLGLLAILATKFLPLLLELFGQSELIGVLPEATAGLALAEYGEGIAQIGSLTAVLLAMGAVSQERERGSAAFILSKPVTRSAFLLAKLVGLCFTFGVALTVAGLLAAFYTAVLFDAVPWRGFLLLNGLLAVFLFFVLCVTLLFSSLFRQILAAGGLALAVVIVLGVGASFPLIGDYLPGSLLRWGSEAVLVQQAEPAGWALATALALCALSVALARKSLEENDV